MSALGIWNNRYEGGECYAACMETFALYEWLVIIVITHRSLFVGKDVIMGQVESMIPRVGNKLKECVRDSRLSRCGLELGNWRKSMI